jgi:hypothetical protein
VGLDGPIDVGALHSHCQKVPEQPGRTPAPGGASLDVVQGEGGIVKQAKSGRPLQSRSHSCSLMSFPLKPPGEIAPGKGARLQCPKSGPESRLDIGRGAEPLQEWRVNLRSNCKVFRANQLARHGAEALAIDLDPNRVRPARIGIECRYPGADLHSIRPPRR